MPMVFPPKSFLPPTRFDELYLESRDLCRICGVSPDPLEVDDVLAATGQHVVIAGSHVASAWAGRPSGSSPVVAFVAEPHRASRLIESAWSDVVAVPSTRHLKRADRYTILRGQRRLVEVVGYRATPVMRRAWKHAHAVRDPSARRARHTTTAEAEAALQWLVAVDAAVPRLRRTQSLAHFSGIVANCPNLDFHELRQLGELAYADGGADLLRAVDDARHERPLSL